MEKLTLEISIIMNKVGFFVYEAIIDTILSLVMKIQWPEIVTNVELKGKHLHCRAADFCSILRGSSYLAKYIRKKSHMLYYNV